MVNAFIEAVLLLSSLCSLTQKTVLEYASGILDRRALAKKSILPHNVSLYHFDDILISTVPNVL